MVIHTCSPSSPCALSSRLLSNNAACSSLAHHSFAHASHLQPLRGVATSCSMRMLHALPQHPPPTPSPRPAPSPRPHRWALASLRPQCTCSNRRPQVRLQRWQPGRLASGGLRVSGAALVMNVAAEVVPTPLVGYALQIVCQDCSGAGMAAQPWKASAHFVLLQWPAIDVIAIACVCQK